MRGGGGKIRERRSALLRPRLRPATGGDAPPPTPPRTAPPAGATATGVIILPLPGSRLCPEIEGPSLLSEICTK
ncbi:hypothetical protein VPH35_056073 [Triticum aestivum]